MGATEFALTSSARSTTCGRDAASPARMKRLTEKTTRTAPKNAGPVAKPVDERRHDEHRRRPHELADDDHPSTWPPVEQDAREGTEHAVGQQHHGEGERDAVRVGRLLGVEQDVAGQGDLEDPVAALRRHTAEEEAAEVGSTQQHRQRPQKGHGARLGGPRARPDRRSRRRPGCPGRRHAEGPGSLTRALPPLVSRGGLEPPRPLGH